MASTKSIGMQECKLHNIWASLESVYRMFIQKQNENISSFKDEIINYVVCV